MTEMRKEHVKQPGIRERPGPEHLTLPGIDSRPSIDSAALSDVPSDVIIKSRIRYGSTLSACKGLLMEYAKSSSIHGIRYIFEVHRPIYEKVYWLFFTCVSVFFAFALIRSAYFKWKYSPVILGFDETLVPVHKIPFPTITVCPESKIDHFVFNYTDVSRKFLEEYKTHGNISNLSDEDLSYMAAAMHICDPEVVQRFSPLLSELNPPYVDVTQTLIDLSIPKNVTGSFCTWNGRFYLFENILDIVVTDEGICYQFNGMHPKDIYRDEKYISYVDPDIVDFNNYIKMEVPAWNEITGTWSLETGYLNQGQNAYPQRTAYSSAKNGFFAFVKGLQHNFDYDCRRFKKGYKVFFNSPESVPLTSANYILVSHGDEVLVRLLPSYVMSTESLREIPQDQRKCFFNYERELRFFRTYSQNNCQTECLANFTVSRCGCAKFWMPKPEDTPVCGLNDIACYTAAQDELYALHYNQSMTKNVKDKVEMMCNCLPACTSLEYNFEISKAKYDVGKVVRSFREEYEDMGIGTRIVVYFKEQQFTANIVYIRTTLFGVSTLISNCGGIFGLCMGISYFSFLELIYFFCMRICGSFRDRRKNKIHQIPRSRGSARRKTNPSLRS
ncbi:pickpocket protein 28-like [Drosophila bipectinata]|uniref:pickpocket protein 28-like n=1 Tax=Drosophila bipectinata TaxID=42026 RepID=UPI0038B312CE